MNPKAVMDGLNPSPIAFMDVFEKGDYWKKIKGCDDCQNSKQCCTNCKFLLSTGCFLHIDNNGLNKPLYCIIKPYPSDQWPYCQQEYKCIKGSNKGKIRRIQDNEGVLV